MPFVDPERAAEEPAARGLPGSSGADPPGDLDVLVPLVLAELRALARRQLRREHGGVTMQTTELVHEAYLRLAGDAAVTGHGRAYFYAAAARAMRQVLVDAARRRGAASRGGGAPLVSLG